MIRMCDTGYRECPQRPQCTLDCHFTTAELDLLKAGAGETTIRKVKPYPSIPDDIEPVPDTWHTIGAWMLGAIMTVLLVICLGLFFTGLWVWSLLI